MTGNKRRLKFDERDIYVAIAALDIVVNKIPTRTLSFPYYQAEKLIASLTKRCEKGFARIGLKDAATILQAIRLALRAVGNMEMDIQAQPVIDSLEGYVNDI